MTIRHSRTALLACLVTLMSGLLLASALLAQASTSKQVWVMRVQGPIGPALSDYLERQLSKADPATVSAAVLQIDTPGGLVAFVAGSVMLLDTDAPGFSVSPWVIAALATVGAGVFLTLFTLMNKARHRPVVSGPEEMLDSVGKVIDWQGKQGRVRVHGEIWQAMSDDSLSPEMPVRVTSRDGLVLTVRKAPDKLTEGQPS